MSDPSFPPLFSGQPVEGAIDPFDKALAEAARGCEAGLVVYNLGANSLRAAIVFAPEQPLEDAIIVLPVCAVGFQNALGALAPPEVAVHLEWSGGLRVNGASCGRLRVAASDRDPKAEPNWIVIGLDLPLWPENDDPGSTPDVTSLYAEGCSEVEPARLLEAWVKHTLVGLNRWSDDGVAPLHREWRGLAHDMGETVEVAGHKGIFMGVDERFGMLLRDDDTTHLIPLTYLLEDG
ncbi:DUF4444 domain-containing protein [Roseovarius faecimaris]|uniref:DUF4444 domain-containing protein n=1 Tax=Roseovarius faecimaris TaxID=2494550 RepID=A0A6I6IJQ8_9RHOB|nr:biotin/lipoate--protein ligase family protein [Roseovarius faecimaris]QGX97049.1 DUF4444 domain-containing protein [Roseovarius faecimaris]